MTDPAIHPDPARVKPTVLQPPALRFDKGMGMTANQAYERRIVWNLIHQLQAAGFEITGVDDGGELTARGNNPLAAMEVIFDLDRATLLVRKGEEIEHGIVLVTGNAGDIISDWNYFADDRDGFRRIMDAFEPEDYL